MRVCLLLQCNQGALHKLNGHFSHGLASLVQVCKGRQIHMVIGTEGNNRHLKRKTGEEEVRRKLQLRQAGGAHKLHPQKS